MPPDPILGILAFFGLFAYAAIGALVASVLIRLCDININYGSTNGLGLVRGLAGETRGNDAAWVGFTFAAAFWPVVAVGLVTFGVVVGPALIAQKIGTYVAKAQIERKAA